MEIFGKSITGRRKSNQDSIYFDSVNEAFIMAVADGVGGNLGGDIASQLTTAVCKTEFHKFAENPKKSNLKSLLSTIFNNSHFEILEMSRQNEKLKQMATTLTIVVGYKSDYLVGNIGDSRTYVIKNGVMNQLTKDHSYIQEYKDKFPELPIDPFVKRQLGNVITRSLNAELEEIDIYPKDDSYFKMEEDEFLLLCSDGLKPDEVSENFEKLYADSSSLTEFVDQIIDFAFNNGSYDNISAIIGATKSTF